MVCGCKSAPLPKKAILVFQDPQLVGFRLSSGEVDRVFAGSGVVPAYRNCRAFTDSDIRSFFGSLLMQNPSLFARKDDPLFPRGAGLTQFVGQIRQTLDQDENPFWFFVRKEDDSLAPFTRIRRTSFYLFCEKNRISVIFGEIQKDITFQNQYTFSEWISAERFLIRPSDKPRIKIAERATSQVDYNNEFGSTGGIVFYDWLNYYNLPVSKSFSSDNPTHPLDKSSDRPEDKNTVNVPEHKQTDIEDRLRILEDLKKKGLVTEPEYNRKRKEILDSL